jgi:hypothetical protein
VFTTPLPKSAKSHFGYLHPLRVNQDPLPPKNSSLIILTHKAEN